MLNESEKIHSHQTFYNIHLCTILTRCFICVISYIFRSTSNYSPSKYIFPVFSSMGVGVLTDTPTTTLHKKIKQKTFVILYIEYGVFFQFPIISRRRGSSSWPRKSQPQVISPFFASCLCSNVCLSNYPITLLQ